MQCVMNGYKCGNPANYENTQISCVYFHIAKVKCIGSGGVTPPRKLGIRWRWHFSFMPWPLYSERLGCYLLNRILDGSHSQSGCGDKYWPTVASMFGNTVIIFDTASVWPLLKKSVLWHWLFQKLLTYDPNRRLSAMEAMSHKYFHDVELQPPPLPPPKGSWVNVSRSGVSANISQNRSDRRKVQTGKLLFIYSSINEYYCSLSCWSDIMDTAVYVSDIGVL
jgi:serine/threonine protein kinase